MHVRTDNGYSVFYRISISCVGPKKSGPSFLSRHHKSKNFPIKRRFFQFFQIRKKLKKIPKNLVFRTLSDTRIKKKKKSDTILFQYCNRSFPVVSGCTTGSKIEPKKFARKFRKRVTKVNLTGFRALLGIFSAFGGFSGAASSDPLKNFR